MAGIRVIRINRTGLIPHYGEISDVKGVFTAMRYAIAGRDTRRRTVLQARRGVYVSRVAHTIMLRDLVACEEHYRKRRRVDLICITDGIPNRRSNEIILDRGEERVFWPAAGFVAGFPARLPFRFHMIRQIVWLAKVLRSIVLWCRTLESRRVCARARVYV